ncbi:MAG: hypothetical protein MZV64_65240 [Ignavibacteriales bacterium]|nr:hypothetical protein [Ignavibacteriales bacterium]
MVMISDGKMKNLMIKIGRKSLFPHHGKIKVFMVIMAMHGIELHSG